MCVVVITVDWLVVLIDDVRPLVLRDVLVRVSEELEFEKCVEVVPELLELVNDVELRLVGGGAVEFAVDGGIVVPGLEDVVFVVVSVVGILQSVVVPTTPVWGCFGVPGGIINFWPISNLSQSRPGLYCCSEENRMPNFSAIKTPYSPRATSYIRQGAVVA